MRFLVIQHDETANDLGALRGPLEAAGSIEIWRTWLEPAPADLDAYDGIVLLGGVAMPDEDDRHPWIPAEVALLGEALRRELPVLGICFGGQVLARAAGAAVGPAPAHEIGWFDIGLTAQGADDPLLGPLGEGYRAFEWHHYGFEMPAGAVPLARNETANQAYRLGACAWGLQFHIEVDRAVTDRWLEIGADHIRAHGVDLEALREETDARVDGNAAEARALAERFAHLARARAEAEGAT